MKLKKLILDALNFMESNDINSLILPRYSSASYLKILKELNDTIYISVYPMKKIYDWCIEFVYYDINEINFKLIEKYLTLQPYEIFDMIYIINYPAKEKLLIKILFSHLTVHSSKFIKFLAEHPQIVNILKLVNRCDYYGEKITMEKIIRLFEHLSPNDYKTKVYINSSLIYHKSLSEYINSSFCNSFSSILPFHTNAFIFADINLQIVIIEHENICYGAMIKNKFDINTICETFEMLMNTYITTNKQDKSATNILHYITEPIDIKTQIIESKL